MNVYEKARELVGVLKEQDVYKEYVESRKQVFSDPKLKEMLLDLRKVEYDMHRRQLEGKSVSDKEKAKLRELHELARLNSVLGRYMEAEYRFGVMMMDIQKIINEVVPVDKPEAKKEEN